MTNQYKAVVQNNNGWWIGWIEEVPGVNCQSETREGLLDDLRDALREALDMNRSDARALAGDSAEEELLIV